MGEQRRLAAIMSADVVGYSRLVGRDESGTLARLRELRRRLFEPALARHDGRLVKLLGDGALVEFPSVVGALAAAIEFQQAMAELNRGQPEDTAIVFRVGLHLGDVVVENGDLYGDGVNVAARLEAEAPPGGIVVSGVARGFVGERLKADFHDMGDLALKNIRDPVRAFQVAWDPAEWPRPAGNSPSDTPRPPIDATGRTSGKPSIAILPFACLGGIPEHEAFADGITESLTTDLSRHDMVSVVAGTTVSALKGAVVDFRQLGRELGVRYAVQGTVQHGARRVRVNVQLVQASDGAHLWADRFDKELGDALDVQDEIAERASRALLFQLREAEATRASTDQGSLHDAESLMVLGRRMFMQGASRANCQRAVALYTEAIQLDGSNPLALALLAITKAAGYTHRWSETPDGALREAVALVDRAMALGPHVPIVLVASAWVAFAERRYAAAYSALERVAQSAPMVGGNAFANLALLKNYVGRSAEAIPELLRVIRVTPADPQLDWWYHYLGLSYIFVGAYQQAADAHAHAITLNASFEWPYLCLAASDVKLGRIAEARGVIDRLRVLGSDWTVSRVKENPQSGVAASIGEGQLDPFWDGLLQAGLPE